MAKQNLDNIFARRPAQASYKRRCQNRETTHYLLCPFMTLYALWYPTTKRSERAKRVTRGRETERQRDKARSGIIKLSATTHYLLCPFMTFYALWYPTTKRSERVTRGKEDHKGQRDRETQRQSEVGHPKIVRDNALPFLPFYDVLCPLVPENEKGKKGHKGQRDTKTKRMTLVIRSALWSCGEGGIGYYADQGLLRLTPFPFCSLQGFERRSRGADTLNRKA